MCAENSVRVNLSQMVQAIENAVSLVGMNDTNHGKRVGYIALQIANLQGMDESDKKFIYELGLLHDCGVSSDTVHGYLANLFDWELSQIHCQIGHDLLKGFAPLSKMAVPILYHHTQWSELGSMDISEFDKWAANLIFIADRVDITAAPHYGPNILLHAETIKKNIAEKSGSYFNPDLVEDFLKISEPEAFWLALEDRHISRFAWSMSSYGTPETLCMDDLKHLARIFSYIVDQKSPFTVQHSYGVAALARYLAQQCGLSAFEVDKVEIAAYFHDIGKIHIPDNILEKKGPLSPTERAVINQHSYETFEILRGVSGLSEIALWAAYHHDNGLGTGYPFHPDKAHFPLQARIIAVSDVFQALVQDRPYRKGMPQETVLKIIAEMAEEGKLDRAVVEIALKDASRCFELAEQDIQHEELLSR